MVTREEQKKNRDERLLAVHAAMLEEQQLKGTTLTIEEVGALTGRPGKEKKSSVQADLLALVELELVEILPVPTRKYKAKAVEA